VKLLYVLSILYLVGNFLVYKKSNEKLGLVSWIIYSICLVFCYNTVSVYFLSLINLGGSLLNYSIINFVIGTLMLGSSLRKKEIQKYEFKKSQLYLVLLIGLVSFMVGYFRFDGFTSISYKSGDPSIHHLHAVYFSEELEILNENNSNDLIFGNFDNIMPASYVNCGFLINIFSGISSYTIFLVYDTICLVLYSALFLVTLFHVIDYNKKNYLYMVLLTLLYTLAYPLNNLLFGFCYLGIGIMNINLIILFIIWFKDNLNMNIIFKIINLFVLTFSLFLTYYLYIPCIYLALGLYYIYLWKKGKITFKQMMMYGVFTLIIPFIIGFCRSMLPGFIRTDKSNIFEYVTFPGSQYTNYSPFLLYVCFIVYYMCIKDKKKNVFWNLNVIILSSYILIFIILYFIGYAALYYLYKLFYLFWLFIVITVAVRFVKNKKVIYILFYLVALSSSLMFMIHYTDFGIFLSKTNIYNWNAKVMVEGDTTVFVNDELEVVDEFIKYKNICVENNNVVLISNNVKNMWFYSITGVIPGRSSKSGGHTLHLPNISYKYWNSLSDYDCAVYFNDNNTMLPEHDHEVLFENESGAILKRDN